MYIKFKFEKFRLEDYSYMCTLIFVPQVWDAGSGSLLQKLPADLPVLDISPFSLNGEHFLGALTEKMLKVYKWE